MNVSNQIFKFVVPSKLNYRNDSKELFRISYHHIHSELMSLCKQWVQKHILMGKGLDTQKKHFLQERLSIYRYKWNRARYRELLHSEYNYICKLSENLREKSIQEIKIVEVGLNKDKHICKIGIVTQLPHSGRYLFLCIGTDRGLKTFYVTPQFKHRIQYKSIYQEVRYLS
jgi:hypothetical protein